MLILGSRCTRCARAAATIVVDSIQAIIIVGIRRVGLVTVPIAAAVGCIRSRAPEAGVVAGLGRRGRRSAARRIDQNIQKRTCAAD